MKRWIVLLGMCLGASLAASAQYMDAPAEIDQAVILRLVNEARAEGCRCGNKRMPPVAPVVWNNTLEQVAQRHSDWMFAKNRFSHTGHRRSSSGDRVRAAGYTWSAVGENIAKGQTSEERVMESWLSSPGHCQNIMNGNFKEMGVATQGPYWTQVFAAPRE